MRRTSIAIVLVAALLAVAVWTGLPVQELALLDLSYAPPFSGVYDPLLIAARATAKLL